MLKAFVAVAGLTFAAVVTGPAQADTLLTGTIRDRIGAAVRGARVTAFDAAGRVVATDVASADGTFAVAAPSAPATVEVSCDYCRSVRRAVRAEEPIVIIVDRFPALTVDGASPADMRALPYRSAADIASLRPFTVVDTGIITDRGLDHDGAVLVSGLPFYRASDGGNASELVPAHSIAALTAASPLDAPVYGGYAEAGTYDVQLRDADVSTSRIDFGGASDVVGRVDAAGGGATVAASSDSGDDRLLASAVATGAVGGGRLSLEALGMSDSLAHASGAGLAYTTDSRRYVTSALLSATQSADSSLLALGARVRNRGPLGLEFGVRATRATSALVDGAAAQFDSALYAAATRQTASSSIAATIAWDRGSDSSPAGGLHDAALIGSLSDDLRVGSHWTLHTGAVSNLRIPTFAEVSAAAPVAATGDRSLLIEESMTYADLRRLRISGETYTQRATGLGTARVNGMGIGATWQIVPQLSLRTWLLRANQSLTARGGLLPYLSDAATAASLTRQLIWLSYDKYVRFDALMRGGALEGDVRIPVSATYALTIGSAQYAGHRVTTFGVTRR